MVRSHAGRWLFLAALGLLALGGCKNRSNRPGDTLTCTPGESLRIGCTSNVGSTCSGDPVMDVCDGSVAPANCTDTNASAMNDDFVGLCPQVDTVCPSGGRITVNVHGYGNASFNCYWDIQHGGGGTTDASTGGGGG